MQEDLKNEFVDRVYEDDDEDDEGVNTMPEQSSSRLESFKLNLCTLTLMWFFITVLLKTCCWLLKFHCKC